MQPEMMICHFFFLSFEKEVSMMDLLLSSSSCNEWYMQQALPLLWILPLAIILDSSCVSFPTISSNVGRTLLLLIVVLKVSRMGGRPLRVPTTSSLSDTFSPTLYNWSLRQESRIMQDWTVSPLFILVSSCWFFRVMISFKLLTSYMPAILSYISLDFRKFST